MKTIFVLIFLFSGLSQAKSQLVAQGKVSLYNSAQSYEVVLDGALAKELFETLEAEPVTVKTANGGWLNKIGRGMVCGQNLNTKKYSCSLNVDEKGIQ